jgi:alkylhydroperoxidase/carboxymuconolactone decarboxylase family protein YurZ
MIFKVTQKVAKHFKTHNLRNDSDEAAIRKPDPEFMSRFDEAEDLIFKDGAVSKKIKLLIAMAFDAADGVVEGVKGLAMRAIKEGATKEELTEVLRVASHFGGIGALYIASIALKEIFPD